VPGTTLALSAASSQSKTGSETVGVQNISLGKPLRVLIAENHADLSETLAQMIDSEPDMRCVGQVASASAVLPAVQGSGANVLVLDLGLQGGSGLELIEGLASSVPELRIVVFSGLCNDVLAREILQRGAAAFVTKGCDPNVLLAQLRPRAAAG
jgi:two-component system, NarL family, invasion response regulator UvrY